MAGEPEPAARDDQRMLRRHRIRLAVSRLRRRELLARSVQIAECEVGNVGGRVSFCQTLEVALRVVGAIGRARGVSKRSEREAVVRVHRQHFVVHGNGVIGTAQLHQDVAVLLQIVPVMRLESDRFLDVRERAVQVAASHLDERTKTEERSHK